MQSEEGKDEAGLEDVTLADVVPRQQGSTSNIVVLQHNNTIGSAMQVLAKHGILSAPVYISPDLEDISTDAASGRPQLLGWIDMTDILQSFLEFVDEKHAASMPMLSLMSFLETEGQRFVDRKLITVMGGHDKTLVYDSNASTPLLAALRFYFLREGKKEGETEATPVHRVALFGDTGEVDAIVSQLDVLKYFTQHRHLLGSLETATIIEAGMMDGERQIAAIDINSPTLLALKHMQGQNHSSLAVISEDNRLITNISSSDLRYIEPTSLGVLALPVGEFLALRHDAVYLGFNPKSSRPTSHKFFARQSSKTPVPLITCNADCTVLQAMEDMVEHRVHRVYVVDDEKSSTPVPLRLITPTDIIKLIVARCS